MIDEELLKELKEISTTLYRLNGTLLAGGDVGKQLKRIADALERLAQK